MGCPSRKNTAIHFLLLFCFLWSNAYALAPKNQIDTLLTPSEESELKRIVLLSMDHGSSIAEMQIRHKLLSLKLLLPTLQLPSDLGPDWTNKAKQLYEDFEEIILKMNPYKHYTNIIQMLQRIRNTRELDERVLLLGYLNPYRGLVKSKAFQALFTGKDLADSDQYLEELIRNLVLEHQKSLGNIKQTSINKAWDSFLQLEQEFETFQRQIVSHIGQIKPSSEVDVKKQFEPTMKVLGVSLRSISQTFKNRRQLVEDRSAVRKSTFELSTLLNAMDNQWVRFESKSDSNVEFIKEDLGIDPYFSMPIDGRFLDVLNAFNNLYMNSKKFAKHFQKRSVNAEGDFLVFRFENDGDPIEERAFDVVDGIQRFFLSSYTSGGTGVGTTEAWLISKILGHKIQLIQTQKTIMIPGKETTPKINSVVVEYRIPIRFPNKARPSQPPVKQAEIERAA